MSYSILMSKGKEFKIPMYDVLVAEHFSRESSYISSLLDDVNTREIYAPLFKHRKELTFLDIGANIGFVSIYASQSCKRIVALEPDPANYHVLQSMTHNFPMIETMEAALAPVDSEVDFYQNDLNTTASSTVNTYGTKTSVRGFTLMNILRINQLEHVDVVKCDCEGCEGEALSLHQLQAARSIVDTYYIETHNCPKTTWNWKLGQLVERLSSLGYYQMTINGMTMMVKP